VAESTGAEAVQEAPAGTVSVAATGATVLPLKTLDGALTVNEVHTSGAFALWNHHSHSESEQHVHSLTDLACAHDDVFSVGVSD